MDWYKFESALWTSEFRIRKCWEHNLIKRIFMQKHILISVFSSFLYNLEKQNLTELFLCESQKNLWYVFILSIVNLRSYSDIEKKNNEKLQAVKGKILLSVKKPTGFCDTSLLSYYSISRKPYLRERKNPPANKQTKNPTHNYFWFDGTKWISVLCSTNTTSDPTSAHSLSL